MGLLRYLLNGVLSVLEVSHSLLALSTIYMLARVVEWNWKIRRSSRQDGKDRRYKHVYSLVLVLENTIIKTFPAEEADQGPFLAMQVGDATVNHVVLKRPHLDTFLAEMSKHYEIVLYSTSQKELADAILEHTQIGHLFVRRLYRSSCIMDADGISIKDLKRISNDLSKVVLIDNSAQASNLFRENWVPLDVWLGGQYDRALLDIIPFLQALRDVEDVRRIMDLRWKANEQSSLVPIARGNREEERRPFAPNNYEPYETPGSPMTQVNWDGFGQRLTSKVKDIFDNLGPDEDFRAASSPKSSH